MRYGIISDIHGNLEALEAVLALLAREKVDEYLCLGDIVGYGADPAACLERVRQVCKLIVAGNHDWAATGRVQTTYFNRQAAAAVRWTGAQLDAAQREFLDKLPLLVRHDGFTLTHGTALNPEQFDYIQSKLDAYFSFQVLETDLCFYGHTHVPVAFFQRQPLAESVASRIPVVQGIKTLVNVGSVGQPRDQDPRAACAIYDREARLVRLLREPYDCRAAAGKILQAGLPRELARRLASGQ